jgi:hypothetical protein
MRSVPLIPPGSLQPALQLVERQQTLSVSSLPLVFRFAVFGRTHLCFSAAVPVSLLVFLQHVV